ncbi:hypothetical protein [Pseudomonas rossensis]|uniref:hypothetical protein n=1 Tax=Pseudomonas rossensis TaxID=2305471 RepID=UPI00326145A1
MSKFKVRTYEENLVVTADRVVFDPDGVRLMFYTGDKITGAFSRYLWVQEEPAAETKPDPAVEPAPEPTPEPAPDTQPE